MGTGFVDIGIVFSSTLHLLELKVITNKIKGPSQLAQYMVHQRRNEGWLVFFDARNPNFRKEVPEKIIVDPGLIRTKVIDINPIPPSKK